MATLEENITSAATDAVAAPLSTNADLSDLSLAVTGGTAITLNETFDAAVTLYTATVLKQRDQRDRNGDSRSMMARPASCSGSTTAT